MNYSCRNKQLGPAPPLRLMPTTINCRYRYSRHLPPRTGALRTRYDTGNVPAETWHPSIHSLQGQTLPRDPSVIPTLSQRPIAPHIYETSTTPSNGQHIAHPHTRRHIDPIRGSQPPLIPRGWPTLTPTKGIIGSTSSRTLVGITLNLVRIPSTARRVFSPTWVPSRLPHH